MISKVCPDCRRTLPSAAFSRNPSRPDGLQFYCKSCFSTRAAAAYRRKRARLGKSVRERREVPIGHKFCPGCNEVKPHLDWHKNASSRDGLSTYCKPCRKAQGRAGHLKRTFGLTPETLAALVESQGDRCAICRSRPPEHVDHDHATRAIRGVLCGPCNMGLGQFRDDPALLRAAARYLGQSNVSEEFPTPLSRIEVDLRDYLERHRAG